MKKNLLFIFITFVTSQTFAQNIEPAIKSQENDAGISNYVPILLPLLFLIIPLFFKKPRILISIILILADLQLYKELVNINILFSFFLYVIIAITSLLCFLDLERDQNPNDNFKGKSLFFRYGEEIFSSSIVLRHSYTDKEIIKPKSLNLVINDFYDFFKENVRSEFSNNQTESVKQFNIHDLNFKNQSKKFLKIMFSTPRKTKIIYFINVELFGNQIIVNYRIYLQGKYFWDDVGVFVLNAPFHIWFWIVKWLRNQYSIRNRLSVRFDESPFESIDFQSIIQSMNFFTLETIKRFAVNNDLFNAETERMILLSIDNSTKLNITKSPNFSIENIGNTINREISY